MVAARGSVLPPHLRTRVETASSAAVPPLSRSLADVVANTQQTAPSQPHPAPPVVARAATPSMQRPDQPLADTTTSSEATTVRHPPELPQLTSFERRDTIDRACPYHIGGLLMLNEEQICPEPGCQGHHICKSWWRSVKDSSQTGCGHSEANIEPYDPVTNEVVIHIPPNCKKAFPFQKRRGNCDNTEERPYFFCKCPA